MGLFDFAASPPQDLQPSGREPSRTAGGFFFFDPDRIFVAGMEQSRFSQRQKAFRYDQLVSFELAEDRDTDGKKPVCRSLVVRVRLMDPETPLLEIPFITTKTKVGGFLYRTNRASADQFIEALQETKDMAAVDQKLQNT